MDLLERLERTYPIDSDRVYAMGVSDGGQMSYRLATERPDRFAAIAAIVAQQAAPENSNCREPRGPISQEWLLDEVVFRHGPVLLRPRRPRQAPCR